MSTKIEKTERTEEILQMVQEKMPDCICQMTKHGMEIEIYETALLDWEEVKTRVYKKVVNYERNQERLLNILHQRYLDLAEVYYIRIPLSEEGWGTCEITDVLLKTWGIQEQELREQAELNMENDSYQMVSVAQVLNFPEGLEPEFYILRNQKNIFSAGVISHPKLMKQFMKQIGGDGYLIPSSVEELLIIPVKEGICKEMLRTMILEVNQECVSLNEFLSNQLYYCHSESGEVEIC